MNEVIQNIKSYKGHSDLIGMLSSGLCMVHCIITPFLFAAHAVSSVSCSEISPFWWKMVDCLFLLISFIAIQYTVKTTSSKYMPFLMNVTWALLAILIINNFVHLLPVPHALIYIPALSLSALHLYNRRYCRCQDEVCCH